MHLCFSFARCSILYLFPCTWGPEGHWYCLMQNSSGALWLWAVMMAPRLLYSKPGEQSLTWPAPQSLFVSSTCPLQRWVQIWQEGIASSHFTFLHGSLLSALLAYSCWFVLSGSSIFCWVSLWAELFCFCFRDLQSLLSSRPVTKLVARIWPCSLSNLHERPTYCIISNCTVQTFTSCISNLLCPCCSSSAASLNVLQIPAPRSRAMGWPAQVVLASGGEVYSGAFHRPVWQLMDWKISSCCLSVYFLHSSLCAHSVVLILLQPVLLLGNPLCVRSSPAISASQCSAGVAVTCAAVTWVHLAVSSLCGPSYWFTVDAVPKGSSWNCSAARRGSWISLPSRAQPPPEFARTLGPNAAACLNAALWPAVEISCVPATVLQVCIAPGMLPPIGFSLLYVSFWPSWKVSLMLTLKSLQTLGKYVQNLDYTYLLGCLHTLPVSIWSTALNF